MLRAENIDGLEKEQEGGGVEEHRRVMKKSLTDAAGKLCGLVQAVGTNRERSLDASEGARYTTERKDGQHLKGGNEQGEMRGKLKGIEGVVARSSVRQLLGEKGGKLFRCEMRSWLH